ncbi:hypothetical protein TWF730_004438 [Orbilia blumenaviensis]|uniref:Kelch repeat-containing protein n=1 Tax=Orbilia blumenaviensis TaxID=1796055 RepID=A0AAV9TZ31_9PEZI
MTTQSPYLLDPIDNFCAISGHSSLVLGNKLYITTGYAHVLENGTNRAASSPWIRSIDLNEPFNLNRTASVTTILPPSLVPVNIPNNQGASFWWDPEASSVIYAQGGGTFEGSGGIIRDANLVSFGRPGKSWTATYNAANNSLGRWGEIDTPFLGLTGQVSSLRRFFDPVTRKGYIYGGSVVSPDGGPRNQVLTYDAIRNSWTNQTSLGIFDDVGAAVSYRTVGGKLLGIIFGGSLNGTPLTMETVFIHDTEGDKWYQQRTNGSPPNARAHFCATTIQAPDDSSMQIFIYGGFGDGHPSDIFTLSLPSFTWSRLEEISPDLLPGPGPRLQPVCEMVNNRFFTIFGGRSLAGGDPAICDVQQNALFMYDLVEKEWIMDYDASTQDYSVPEPVYRVIGGNSSGYATMTQPPGGYAEAAIAELFSTPSATYSPLPTETSAPSKSKGPNIAGIAGGVVGAVVILAGILVWWYFRRRARRRNLAEFPFITPPPPPRPDIVEAPSDRPHASEFDAFPPRPEIMELNGIGILKPHNGPPVELAVMEFPAHANKQPNIS